MFHQHLNQSKTLQHQMVSHNLHLHKFMLIQYAMEMDINVEVHLDVLLMTVLGHLSSSQSQKQLQLLKESQQHQFQHQKQNQPSLKSPIEDSQNVIHHVDALEMNALIVNQKWHYYTQILIQKPNQLLKLSQLQLYHHLLHHLQLQQVN